MFQKRPCAFRKMAYICIPQRCVGRVVRRRSAKPVTVVRFRYAPLEMPLNVLQGHLLFQKAPQISHFCPVLIFTYSPQFAIRNPN